MDHIMGSHDIEKKVETRLGSICVVTYMDHIRASSSHDKEKEVETDWGVSVS